MALDHSARILVDESGNVFLATEGGSTPASVFGFIGITVDGGGVARAVLSDTSGRQVIVGAGTAGTPAGGVLTIQGVSGGVVVPVSDGGGSLTVDTTQLPGALVGGRLDTNLKAWFGATTPTVGQKAMAASIPVTLASDQTAIPTTPGTGAGGTATITNVTKSGSSVLILAANTARIGASVFNDSNRAMYLKFGTAATTTSFTVKVEKDFLYEVAHGYTGVLHAVWDTGGSGDARITEVTA